MLGLLSSVPRVFGGPFPQPCCRLLCPKITLRLGERPVADYDPFLRRDFVRHEAAGPNLPVRMFVAIELSHEVRTSNCDDRRSGGVNSPSDLAADVARALLFPGGIAHAELIRRPGLVDLAGSEDGAGKFRLIRAVGEVLRFQTDRTAL